MNKVISLILLGVLSTSYANESYYKNGKLIKLQNIYISRSINRSGIDYYKTANGQKVGITDEILVQCKEGISCSKLLHDFNLKSYSKLTDRIFIVKIEDYDSIFDISRKLFESGNVEFAHPNFIKERQRR